MIVLYVTIALILLAMGLGLTPGDFRRVRERPRGAIAGLVGQIIGLPLLGIAVAAGFGLQGPLAIGMVVLTACPGGAHSNLITSFAHGDVALSVSLTAVSGVLTIISIPLWLQAGASIFAQPANSGFISPSITDTFAQLCCLILLPLAAGMLVRHRQPRLAARVEPIIKTLALVALVLIIAGATYRQAPQLADLVSLVGFPVLVLNLLAMCLGYALARLSSVEKRQTISLVIEVGVQNTALCYFIAAGLLGNETIAVPGIVYSLLVYVTSFALIVLLRLVTAGNTGVTS